MRTISRPPTPCSHLQSGNDVFHGHEEVLFVNIRNFALHIDELLYLESQSCNN